jgi:hypothetical protein
MADLNVYTDDPARAHILYAPCNTGVVELDPAWKIILENNNTGRMVIPPSSIVVCNKTNAVQDFSLALLRDGDLLTVCDDKRLYNRTPLVVSDETLQGETYELPSRFHLRTGESIAMKTTNVDAVNVFINYLQQQ